MGAIHVERSGLWSAGLTEPEQATVMAITADALAQAVGHTPTAFDVDRFALTPALRIARATFVTLHKGGMLRGCIGSLQPEAPLFQSVHDNALAAALHDPRFPSVTGRELLLLEVSVSILSPVEPIDTIAEFRIGEHGIILEKGWRRAVYLPEVATEQGWTVEETLISLCQKAGLPTDAWRTGASFKVFSSEVLSRRHDV